MYGGMVAPGQFRPGQVRNADLRDHGGVLNLALLVWSRTGHRGVDKTKPSFRLKRFFFLERN